MFNDDRSDFAAPIAGFLYIGLVAVISCFALFNSQSKITDFGGIGITYYLGVAGLIIAGFNLYKAYLVEGFTFALAAIFTFAIGVAPVPVTFLGLVFIFAVCGVLSYLSGYLDLTIINGVFAVASIFIGFDPKFKISVLPAILLLAVAGVAIYVAICDWMVAQDVLDAYEEEFCCDCDEGCCCGEDSEAECTCEECADKQ